MKRKRADIDEVEEGGRAKVVEELVLRLFTPRGNGRLRRQEGAPQQVLSVSLPIGVQLPFDCLRPSAFM